MTIQEAIEDSPKNQAEIIKETRGVRTRWLAEGLPIQIRVIYSNVGDSPDFMAPESKIITDVDTLKRLMSSDEWESVYE